MIFVNDLPSVVSHCRVLMYADDTVLYFASNSVSEIEDVLNYDLHLLQTWLLDNNLFLNKKRLNLSFLVLQPDFLVLEIVPLT